LPFRGGAFIVENFSPYGRGKPKDRGKPCLYRLYRRRPYWRNGARSPRTPLLT